MVFVERQIIIVECLGKFTDTVKLDWDLWLLSLAMGLFRFVHILEFIASQKLDVYAKYRLSFSYILCYTTKAAQSLPLKEHYRFKLETYKYKKPNSVSRL